MNIHSRKYVALLTNVTIGILTIIFIKGKERYYGIRF